MPTPVVWSERPEPYAPGLRDCAYSSVLMCLVHGGWVRYPLGIYTAQEREALERSDNQPDETGADIPDLIVAVRRRYGLTITESRSEGLTAALATTGIALAIQGRLSNLPAGHAQRRWDPDFTGSHMVCVLTGGAGRNVWLDPLAPNKFAGDMVADSVVMTYARGLGDYIPVRRGALSPLEYTREQMEAAVELARGQGYAAAKAKAIEVVGKV